MDLFQALGPAVVQELGNRRDSLPTQLLLDEGAATRLATFLGQELGARRVAVVFDQRTHDAAGQGCFDALQSAGLTAVPQLLPDRDGHEPVCDDRTKAWLEGQLPQVDVLLGVGSGVISDLTKWLAFERSRPAAVFATAASMNGYSAANVAPAIDGVKSLFSARAHRVIAADPKVLAAAPTRLTSAGLGDVIAKVVSTLDWKMNALLFGEHYSDAVAGIIDHVEARFLSHPARLRERNASAVSALFEALVYSGAAMTLQGSSLPASGGEHLISHALDMRADAHGQTHDLHGRQVGVATIFAAGLYERILAMEAPRISARSLPLDRAGWGPIADSVEPHRQKQARRMEAACQTLALPGAWPRLRDTLRPMLKGPAWVKRVLSEAGAAHRVEDLGIDRERFLWAVFNCAQMRERFTSIDLAWALGVLPDVADELVDEFLI